MGALQAFDPATGTWETITTTGPVGAPGPQGIQGEQGIQGPAGGAVVLYRSPYINTWTSDASTSALKAVFEETVQIDDPTGDFLVVSGWRCLQDFGATYNQAQLEVKVGSYTAPTHSVFSAAGEQGLWGGVSRVWFPEGSAIAAAPGPVTVSMKMIANVASRIVYDPSLVLVQLNTATTGGGAGTWVDAVLESGVTGGLQYKVSGGVCSVSYDITRAANILPTEVIATLPVEARPPAPAFLFGDLGGNMGVRSLVRVDTDGTVRTIQETSVANGMSGNGTYGTA